MNGQTTGKVRAKAVGAAMRGGAGCREIVRRSPRGRTGRNNRRGFTLIELLVVISIIALLVAIMVPSLAMARELARRAACAVNLRNIGTGLALYSEVHGEYPYVPLNGAGWGVAVGTNREADPYDGVANGRNPTSNLYLLVRGGMCPAGMFVCRSAGEKPGRGSCDGRWDFPGGDEVSYAVMNPYGDRRNFVEAPGSVILLADGSPYFDPATGLRNSTDVVNLGGDPSEEDIRRGNSRTHLGDGQNVARVGGSTRFERRADCGADFDNIYTRGSGDDGTDPGGGIPAPGGDGSAADQGPAGEHDSYLVP